MSSKNPAHPLSYFVSFVAFWMLIQTAFSAPLEVSCIGSPHAKNKLIYLHGADTQPPGLGEQWTRYYLGIMAERLDLQIALPRSQDPCPAEVWEMFGGAVPYCWEREHADPLIADIRESASKCFDLSKGYGVLGFSAGGRLLHKWFLDSDRYIAEPQYFVTVASTRDRQLSESVTARLRHFQPKISFVYGNQDGGTDSNLALRLARAGLATDTYIFNGGHTLDPLHVESAIYKRLSELRKK